MKSVMQEQGWFLLMARRMIITWGLLVLVRGQWYFREKLDGENIMSPQSRIYES
jgi:hypothetical protein